MNAKIANSDTNRARRIHSFGIGSGLSALLLALGAAYPMTATAFECTNNGAGAFAPNDSNNATNTACGNGTVASGGGQNTAVGNGAVTGNITGGENTAVGDNAAAGAGGGDRNAALGNNAEAGAAGGDGNTAVGDSAQAGQNGGSGNVALGDGASASPGAGAAATALGNGAAANAANSVALGAGSVADEANTVSVGSPGSARRITNVARAVRGTDAINKNQLDGARDDLRRGIAAAVSLVTLTPSGPGRTVMNVGWGHFESENAVGFTVNHRLKAWEDRGPLSGTLLMFNAGAAYGINGEPVVRAGASFEF